MAYEQYITKINTQIQNINTKTNNISSLNLESEWSGTASTKQLELLKTNITNIGTQLEQLKTLNEAMTLIDQYDQVIIDKSNYKKERSNLDKKDKNYSANNLELTDKIIELTTKEQELKLQISNKLGSISSSYTEAITKINKTEITETISTLNEIKDNILALNFNIITDESQNSAEEETSTLNAGEISLDKQGTYYEKEPTPGKGAQKLHVYHNDTRLYDDAEITMKLGDTIRLNVNLSDNAGNVTLLTRTSADGYRSDSNPENNWTNYFSAYSEPYVDRDDSKTFLNTDNFEWVITADKVTNGYVTLSQTTFHNTDKGTGYKSMYRIKVKVIE